VATTADFRNGMVLEMEDKLFTLVEFQHVKPGKGGAFVRTRLKNAKTGAVLERTFRSGEAITEVRLERRKMQYLYASGDIHTVMDQETFEQITLSEQVLSEALPYVKENGEVTLLVRGEEVVGVEVPLFVDLVVAETEPGFKGDTASAATKPAKLETGHTVKVPLFINPGDVVKVDTRTGEYLGRS
jgi:elongation factor P